MYEKIYYTRMKEQMYKVLLELMLVNVQKSNSLLKSEAR